MIKWKSKKRFFSVATILYMCSEPTSACTWLVFFCTSSPEWAKTWPMLYINNWKFKRKNWNVLWHTLSKMLKLLCITLSLSRGSLFLEHCNTLEVVITWWIIHSEKVLIKFIYSEKATTRFCEIFNLLLSYA